MGWLKTRDTYKGLSEAASLGLCLLKRTKQNTWQELLDAMEAGDPQVIKVFRAIELTDHQLATVNAHQPVLLLMQLTPAVVPAVCPACGHFILVSDSTPTKCVVGAGCEGRPDKIAAATGAKEAPGKSAAPEKPGKPGPSHSFDEDFEDDPFG